MSEHLVPYRFQKVSVNNTKLTTWFERDRAHVGLECARTGKSILDVWDGAVAEAVEDGFLTGRGFCMGRMLSEDPLHTSMVQWALAMGANPRRPIVIRPDEPEESEPETEEDDR